MRRRRYSNSSDYAFEDHSGDSRTNFLTVLGNEEFYYEFQYSGVVFPRVVNLVGRGIERCGNFFEGGGALDTGQELI